jgi:serine protease inhibitor
MKGKTWMGIGVIAALTIAGMGAALSYMTSITDSRTSQEMSSNDSIKITNPKNVVDANNQFALNFYSKVSQGDDNVFFSPWSISTAFAIAYEGARGNTAHEIQDAFGFIEDDEERRTSFASVHDDLNQKDSQYKLHVANALWVAEGFEIFPEYVDVAKTYYDSEIDTVNFEADGAEIINKWVSDKTEQKIEELFDPDSLGGVRLAITNAIYFNGTWVLPFDEKRTTEQDFFVNSQKTIKAPMMSRDSYYNYTSTDELQILELPYLGDKLSMLIILPNEIDGIKSLEGSFDAQKIAQWNEELSRMRLFVSIPKFIMETDYDLIPELKELGISAAFGPADFSGISNADLYISQAVHKAFVNVNEKGTEAAAATGITMRESRPPSFTADHPFVFIIQDTETGNILFIGKVMDPTQ